jgi:hypothetical protein
MTEEEEEEAEEEEETVGVAQKTTARREIVNVRRSNGSGRVAAEKKSESGRAYGRDMMR